MTADHPDYMAMLTAGQATRILGVSSEYLRQLAVAGRIPSTNTPYGRLYKPQDVEHFQQTREQSQQRLDGVKGSENGSG